MVRKENGWVRRKKIRISKISKGGFREINQRIKR